MCWRTELEKCSLASIWVLDGFTTHTIQWMEPRIISRRRIIFNLAATAYPMSRAESHRKSMDHLNDWDSRDRRI
ncbi:hypothetical protein CHARACLAT_000491 [Characodon lateralis]|uniref:Uncharacterized protein n=1 Tax=Characodon lateralis TaxID=208331 RepID=A0ABU7EZP5_9TELE|nr:hypothetical protein [Characodon lateralis]